MPNCNAPIVKPTYTFSEQCISSDRMIACWQSLLSYFVSPSVDAIRKDANTYILAVRKWFRPSSLS